MVTPKMLSDFRSSMVCLFFIQRSPLVRNVSFDSALFLRANELVEHVKAGRNRLLDFMHEYFRTQIDPVKVVTTFKGKNVTKI